MIGLWLADIWTRAGRPDAVHYVELGPGRGTLARDALGAAARFGCDVQDACERYGLRRRAISNVSRCAVAPLTGWVLSIVSFDEPRHID